MSRLGGFLESYAWSVKSEVLLLQATDSRRLAPAASRAAQKLKASHVSASIQRQRASRAK